MLDAIEEFGLHRKWRLAQIVGGVGEIIPHQSERALETLLIAAAPFGATPSLLKFPKLNYLCHRQSSRIPALTIAPIIALARGWREALGPLSIRPNVSNGASISSPLTPIGRYSEDP
jgi:hypothetical protein